MTAPALAQTWYSRQNVLFPDVTSNNLIHQSYLFELKHLLMGDESTGDTNGSRPVGSKWACEGSSNGGGGGAGVSYGMDAVDRWTTTFDASKLVMANAGTTHSWIVLSSPAALGPIYMCIDLNSAAAGTAGFIFSNNAFTGGTNLLRPTATQEWAVNLSSAPTTSTNWAFSADFTAAAVFRAHFTVTATGEWCYATSRDTSLIFHSFLACMKLTNTTAGDTSRCFTLSSQSASGRGAPNTGQVGAATGCTGRVWNNSTVKTTGGLNTWTFGGTALSSMKADVQLSKNLSLPHYLVDATAGFETWRGQLNDLYAVTAGTGGATVGGSFPNQGAPVQTVAGDFIVPFGCVPQL